MGNAPSTSRVVGIILMVAGIVAIPLAAYYLFYVTGQQDFQTRRSLRAVHEITVQLDDRISRGRLVNMSNERVLLSLAKSRLVKMAPYPQIVTPSFELFIRRAETDKTIAAWEEKAGMGLWSVIRIPFFAVILLGVMFLAVTTPESFQALLAIVATATAGIPLILRAFSGVGGSRAG